jgi:hypothetical protein
MLRQRARNEATDERLDRLPQLGSDEILEARELDRRGRRQECFTTRHYPFAHRGADRDAVKAVKRP